MSQRKIPFQSQFDLNVEIFNEKEIESKRNAHLDKLKTGTTTVGLVCTDGVCLATDKRATMGFFIASKTAEKLHMIQPYMWMTIAGGVADAQYLIDIMRAETNIYNLKNNTEITIKGAATLLGNICYQNKGAYEVGLILGGVTSSEGGVIYDVGGEGSVLREKFCSIGSGSRHAIAVLESKFSPDLTVEQGMDICTLAIRSSLLRDIGTGNGIDVVGITKNGYTRKSYSINEDPIEKIDKKSKKADK